MNTQEFLKPDTLERNSFLWSEARLVIAAVALVLGGTPVLRALLPMQGLYGFVGFVLTLCWVVSGAASAYLLYRWVTGGKVLFGGTAQLDTAAFLVSVVSGLNLGLTGLTGNNLGMSLLYGRFVFGVTGLIYVAAAIYLYQRWNASGKKIF